MRTYHTTHTQLIKIYLTRVRKRLPKYRQVQGVKIFFAVVKANAESVCECMHFLCIPV